MRGAGLKFDEVEPKEWIRRLRASSPDPAANPPIKLVDFFASMYDKDEFGPSKSYETRKACELSSTLANATVLDLALVTKLVQRFSTTAWKPIPVQDEKGSPSKTAIIITGPCGSGKTTVGQQVAQRCGGAFIEGDSLHTRDERMRCHRSLPDSDRRAWLDRIKGHVMKAACVLHHDTVVVSCSALRKTDRDSLRRILGAEDAGTSGTLDLLIIDLQASRDVVRARVMQRDGHYMTAEMDDGQISGNEAIQVEEDDVVPVNAEGSPEEVLEDVLWAINRRIKRTKC